VLALGRRCSTEFRRRRATRALRLNVLLDVWGSDIIKSAFQEALELAENALDVMNNHAQDADVQRMAQCILGSTDYQANFDAVRCTY
jgi:hypothetical protein